MNQDISEPHHTFEFFRQFSRYNTSPEKNVETFSTFLREPELLLLYHVVGQIKNLFGSTLKIYGYGVCFIRSSSKGMLEGFS